MQLRMDLCESVTIFWRLNNSILNKYFLCIWYFLFVNLFNKTFKLPHPKYFIPHIWQYRILPRHTPLPLENKRHVILLDYSFYQTVTLAYNWKYFVLNWESFYRPALEFLLSFFPLFLAKDFVVDGLCYGEK